MNCFASYSLIHLHSVFYHLDTVCFVASVLLFLAAYHCVLQPLRFARNWWDPQALIALGLAVAMIGVICLFHIP